MKQVSNLLELDRSDTLVVKIKSENVKVIYFYIIKNKKTNIDIDLLELKYLPEKDILFLKEENAKNIWETLILLGKVFLDNDTVRKSIIDKIFTCKVNKDH